MPREYVTLLMFLLVSAALLLLASHGLEEPVEIVVMRQANETCYLYLSVDAWSLAGSDQVRVYRVIAEKGGQIVVFEPVGGEFAVVRGRETIVLAANATCPYYPDTVRVEAEKPTGGGWVPVFIPVFYPVP